MSNVSALARKRACDTDEGKWRQRFLFLVAEGWFQEQASWYLELPEVEHLGEFEEALARKIDLRIKCKGDAR